MLLSRSLLLFLYALLASSQEALAGPDPEYPWLDGGHASQTIENRFTPLPGFRRLEVPNESFAACLRRLPFKPGRPPVMLFDGTPKRNQFAHLAVVDIDIGNRDLQQCADAVIRLWGEYLWVRGKEDELCFHITSGAPVAWVRWKNGERPTLAAAQLRWTPPSLGRAGAGHTVLRSYLEYIFSYAGTASFERYHSEPRDEAAVMPGDVFLQGGYPGHAVLVVDVIEDASGRRRFMLVQSYMPAQEIHVLDNPANPGSAWFELPKSKSLRTPEWTFPAGALRSLKPSRKCR